MKSPAIQTADQAIRMYSAIEALLNQFKSENRKRRQKCANCGAPILKGDTSCVACGATDFET
jgi:uncharacterized OB-fold protein